jgi:hypothetical protein
MRKLQRLWRYLRVSAPQVDDTSRAAEISPGRPGRRGPCGRARVDPAKGGYRSPWRKAKAATRRGHLPALSVHNRSPRAKALEKLSSTLRSGVRLFTDTQENGSQHRRRDPARSLNRGFRGLYRRIFTDHYGSHDQLYRPGERRWREHYHGKRLGASQSKVAEYDASFTGQWLRVATNST